MKYVVSKNVIDRLDRLDCNYNIITKEFEDNENLTIIELNNETILDEVKRLIKDDIIVNKISFVTYRLPMGLYEDLVNKYGKELVIFVKDFDGAAIIDVASCIDLAQLMLSFYALGKQVSVEQVNGGVK